MNIKPIRSIASLSIIVATVAFAVVGCATHEHGEHMVATSVDAYPLKTCVVSGEDLGKEPYVFTRNGHTVKLCCKDCLAKFDKEPDKYMAKLAQAK